MKQRSGSAVAPVFISLDPSHDTPAELKRFVGSLGSVGMVALTGDADGVSHSLVTLQCGGLPKGFNSHDTLEAAVLHRQS